MGGPTNKTELEPTFIRKSHKILVGLFTKKMKN